ncbi:MAG: CBS domain-containing protein [Xanthomonadales bacterium]|nr:CBS domain-containing protein [Xanthomonadales bacterium]
MGEQSVTDRSDEQVMRTFMKALLQDVRAMEHMLDSGMFETGIRRIGAEQEMFLVDSARRPALSAMQMMEVIDDPRFTYELAQFNLEANLTPLTLGGDCLRQMENEALDVMKIASDAARSIDRDVILCGILPTLTHKDLSLDSMVPMPRYRALNDALVKLRGSDFNLAIKGIDDLELAHDNVMLEACNASFQVHFQVAPDEFANLYNLAQLITAPVMSASVNSPLLLGKRLWKESRIAVFEHSIDSRTDIHKARGLQPRVHFGEHWIDDSVLEIFKEDIARFRVVLTTESEDPMKALEQGRVPKLNALRLHNGTVYRWNRACYGITDDKPHLRIEHRVLPSGPTILDEVANAAFFFGLMSELPSADIPQHMPFDDARTNFFKAARYGLQAQLTWLDGEQISALELVRDRLIPAARSGLAKARIRKRDIERYMGVLEGRVESEQTAARWMLRSLQAMDEETMDQKLRRLTDTIVVRQRNNNPVHTWELICPDDNLDWRESYRTVGQYMTTNLFTVRANDLVDFAASLMEWRHIRHVPVEDDAGRLVGLVSHRDLLGIIARGEPLDGGAVSVRDIMNPHPLSVTPDCSTVEVIRIMREKGVACLPVVHDDKLVGVVTEADLIVVAGKLLEAMLQE